MKWQVLYLMKSIPKYALLDNRHTLNIHCCNLLNDNLNTNTSRRFLKQSQTKFKQAIFTYYGSKSRY